MAAIHLMVGFIGFGKTTIAKQLAKDLNGKCFTHDELMVERYGNNPDDFKTKYKIVDNYIKQEASKCICNNQDVILDYGFWDHATRYEYYNWAKKLTDDVIFHVVECDLNTAKKRVLNRTKTDPNALFIDKNIFNVLLTQYEHWSDKDNFPFVFHKSL